MAQDIFIKLDGIAGESRDAAHFDEIDVISWAWEVSQDSSMMTGSGGGAAKATVSDLVFIHEFDRASPNLAKYCFTGKHIERAALTMRRAGGTPHEFARITMYDVVITKVAPTVSGSLCHENVRLSFSTMKHEYILQSPLGGNGGAVTAMMYIKQNSAVK